MYTLKTKLCTVQNVLQTKLLIWGTKSFLR